MAASLEFRLLLVALPLEVICADILPHLSVRDFQALDTAFTNKLHQPRIRDVWKSFQWKRLDITLPCDELMFLHRLGVRIIELKTPCHHLVSNVFSSVVKLTSKCCSSDDALLLDIANYCPQLEVLRLPCGEYSDIGITAVAQQCHQLHSIKLCCDDISDDSIQLLCDNCPLLRHIEIMHCGDLTDASLIAIASVYPQLQSFNLIPCDFTDDAFIYFAQKCHELRSILLFAGAYLASSGLVALWEANPNLLEVKCYDRIIPLAQCCHKLQRLDISQCDDVSDTTIFALAKHCRQLNSLDISFCANISDVALLAVALNCAKLRSLNIKMRTKLSDVSLITLGQHCHELKSINLSYLKNISDVGMVALAAGCPLLQEIYVGSITSDRHVIALANGCRNLRKIELMFCSFTDGKSILAIAKNCLLISELILWYCKGLDDTCLYFIAEHCRNLTILKIPDMNCSHAAIKNILVSCRILRKLIIRRGILSSEVRLHIYRRYSNVLVEV